MYCKLAIQHLSFGLTRTAPFFHLSESLLSQHHLFLSRIVNSSHRRYLKPLQFCLHYTLAGMAYKPGNQSRDAFREKFAKLPRFPPLCEKGVIV